jgi:hypothetical protein
MKKLARVVWRARFVSFVAYDGTEEDLDDRITDIPIPECEDATYVENSFDVISIDEEEE